MVFCTVLNGNLTVWELFENMEEILLSFAIIIFITNLLNFQTSYWLFVFVCVYIDTDTDIERDRDRSAISMYFYNAV